MHLFPGSLAGVVLAVVVGAAVVAIGKGPALRYVSAYRSKILIIDHLLAVRRETFPNLPIL